MNVKGVTLPDEAKTELLGLLRQRIHSYKTEIVRSNKDILDQKDGFPAETLFPFASISNLA